MEEMDEHAGSLPQVYHPSPTSLRALALTGSPRVRGYVVVAQVSYMAAGFYWMASLSVPGKKTALQLPEAPVFFIPLPPDAMMSLGTQFLEVQYNQLLFQLQRTHLGGAQRGIKLLWCPIARSWCLLNVICSRPSRTFSADTTSRSKCLKKLRVITTSPNITNKIIKGYTFMVFLFFF